MSQLKGKWKSAGDKNQHLVVGIKGEKVQLMY